MQRQLASRNAHHIANCGKIAFEQRSQVVFQVLQPDASGSAVQYRIQLSFVQLSFKQSYEFYMHSQIVF